MKWLNRIIRRRQRAVDDRLTKPPASGAIASIEKAGPGIMGGSPLFPEMFVTLGLKGWVLRGALNPWSIADFITEQQAQHPDSLIFGILEDVHQAHYTSGHAAASLSIDGFDNESGEHGALSSPPDFARRLASFKTYLSQTEKTDWRGVLLWRSGECAEGRPRIMTAAQQINPDQLGRDTETVVYEVPVQHGYDAIASFPNGYFTCDLGPAQNYHLAKALYDELGLQLIGLGASYLGFYRRAPLSETEAGVFAALMEALYSGALVTKLIAELAAGQTLIFINYTD